MAEISQYSQPIQQSLQQYVPMPFEDMLKAGAAIQARGDAADAQNQQVQTGLSSMEALAPGYSQFRDKFASDFKSKASQLLDQYGGNTSNPEFIRASKQLNTQYASDPRLQTIKQGNELYKQNQQIAAKMQAEGKLYIQPKFTGLDSNGKITANVPDVQGVNTLEDWTNRFKTAHESLEDIGNVSTNTRNLDNTRKLILQDINSGGPESSKLIQAYQQQGLSPERAKQAVISNLSGLTNQYGKVTKTNTALLGLDLEREQFAYKKQQDAAKLDIDKFKAETARQKALTGKAQPDIKAPSFNEFPNRIGSIATTGTADTKDANKDYIFGSGVSQYGTSDKSIKNTPITGKIYDISGNNLSPVNKTVDVKDGNLKGYVNAWTNAKTGELIASPTATSKPRIENINGKTYAYKDGKPYEVQQRTMAEYNYLDGADAHDKTVGTLKTFYKQADPKEAMREMGYSNAYYDGMGRTSHGSAYDSNGKARLDYNYIKQHIGDMFKGGSASDIPEIQKAEAAYNSNNATPEQKQILDGIGSYDSRKSTYDKEILPYFKDQSKTKSIVTEEDE